MTGEGPYYQEGHKVRVQCKEFREDMALELMERHTRTQQGRAAEEIYIWVAYPLGEEPRTYWMDLPTTGVPRSCPVEGCPG